MNKSYSDEHLIRAACHKFDIEVASASLIRSNKNLIYDCGDKILRISPSNIRSKSEIETELDWLSFLGKNGLPVVELIQSNGKNYLEVIEGQGNYNTVVCFHKIIGERISKPYWNGDHFKRLGNLTGMLHRVSKQYEQKDYLTYQAWDTIYEFKCHQYLPVDERKLPQLHQKIAKQINQLPKTKENYGLIHYDIHHGNYLITQQNTELKLFDFEVACNSWYINDISTVLYYANHFPQSIENDAFENYFMSQFWEGYEQEHRIDEEEKAWIPKFLLYRDLMVYGFLCKTWDKKELAQHEIKYLEMIQASIKRRSKYEKN